MGLTGFLVWCEVPMAPCFITPCWPSPSEGTLSSRSRGQFCLANQCTIGISAANRRSVCPLQCIRRVPQLCAGRIREFIPRRDCPRRLPQPCQSRRSPRSAHISIRLRGCSARDCLSKATVSAAHGPVVKVGGFACEREHRRACASAGRLVGFSRRTNGRPQGYVPAGACVGMARRSADCRTSICQFFLPRKCARIILLFGFYAAGARRQRPA